MLPQESPRRFSHFHWHANHSLHLLWNLWLDVFQSLSSIVVEVLKLDVVSQPMTSQSKHDKTLCHVRNLSHDRCFSVEVRFH